MRMSSWLASAVGAAALAFVVMPAQAAPSTAATGNTVAQGVAAPEVDQVRHRCYRHRGHWHCPRHRHYRSYGYSPYYYGGGPSFGLYIGPGYGHGHRHHHRRHRH